MRTLISRFFVVLLAVAFAASGMAWQSCLALQPTPALDFAAQHFHGNSSQPHAQNGKHHHHIDTRQSGADTDQQSTDDHSCVKCCSLCIVSGVTPANASDAVVFTVSSIIFAFEKSHFFGQTVRIDPGIPKRTV